MQLIAIFVIHKNMIKIATDIDFAVKLLNSEKIIGFPTETVYGLAGNIFSEKAINRIFETKQRPKFNPLIVHIASMNDMDKWCESIPAYAISLARDFWPGPMTLILKRSHLAQDFITGGQETVGVRVPDHVLALALLSAFSKIGGVGIAAPSANRFGQVSPTTAQAVQEEIGDYLQSQDQIMDGGASHVGVESTIIDCTHELPRILRPGAITEEMIIDSTGLSLLEKAVDVIRVSGSLENHYSPKAKVFLDTTSKPGQGFIALAEIQTPEGVIRLAAPRDIDEYARLLYSALRSGDNQGLTEIAVIAPDGEGLAVAIRDRLLRASRGR
jgi:L-threonylcarbamoyladenylate synthase